MSYDPKAIESRVSEYWETNSIVEKVRESTEGNKPFFMIDGPPYLNGPPHVGHMQGKVFKDVMLRFKQMQGYDVWDQAGFDTHGLPNELASEEELGIESKNEIGTDISASTFIEECRKRATSAQDLWKGVMGDLAIWQDFDDPYMTYDDDYIESEWWLVREAEEQGLLYTAKKPIHWCPRCQTSLSGYEVTDEYQEVDDLAVFVRFPLVNRDESVLIWTTTPWTIPANMAVYVHPDFHYARVHVDGEQLIVAEQLVDRVMEQAGYDEDDYTIQTTFQGIELQGKKYEHPFLDEIPRQKDLDEEQGVHRVHTSEELVTLEEGTGLVHAATGHGLEDYEVTRQIDLPVFSPVDREGKYTQEAGKYEGEYVHDVNQQIADDLEDRGLLFHSQWFSHEYPHCWRCKTELVYRAAQQWFIKNEAVKQRMLEENEDVDWIPDNIKRRFHNFVEDSPDWCISRQNYWGVPIPIWTCSRCDDYEVIGSFRQLADKRDGLPDDFDPHKHVVDDLVWECDCGGTKERIEDILDVWFDSGCAPFASLHYPFEDEPLESMWPMDFITEASDQIRGWFYSLMFCGILGFDEAPYDTILFQAHVLDDEGKKMSKSLGNVVDPQEQVEKFGADLPRFYSCRVAPPWKQTKYDEDEIEQEIYRLFSVYWNTKEFYETHGDEVDEPDRLQPVDRWIVSRLHNLIADAEERMETCHYHELARQIEDFILDDLSRWYVKAVRSRVKDGDQAANWTLRHVINNVNLLLAPMAPYITEKVFQDLDGTDPSVHMLDYPEFEPDRLHEHLEQSMQLAREVVEQSISLRDENGYNLRWPSKRMTIATEDEHKEQLQGLEQLIKGMANVESVEFGEVSSRLTAKPDYSELGPKYGSSADKVANIIENLEHDQIEQLLETGEIVMDGYDIEEDDVEVTSETRGDVGSKDFSEGQLYLDLHMNDEIERKAFVQEVIRAIQQKRKEADLDVEDSVDLAFDGDTDTLKELEETVRDRINLRDVDYDGATHDHTGTVEFKGREVTFSFSEPV